MEHAFDHTLNSVVASLPVVSFAILSQPIIKTNRTIACQKGQLKSSSWLLMWLHCFTSSEGHAAHEQSTHERSHQKFRQHYHKIMHEKGPGFLHMLNRLSVCLVRYRNFILKQVMLGNIPQNNILLPSKQKVLFGINLQRYICSGFFLMRQSGFRRRDIDQRRERKPQASSFCKWTPLVLLAVKSNHHITLRWQNFIIIILQTT